VEKRIEVRLSLYYGNNFLRIARTGNRGFVIANKTKIRHTTKYSFKHFINELTRIRKPFTIFTALKKNND
jgi:hypothetical protein